MGKIEGNIVGLPSPRSDWNQTNENKADFIKNKPEIVESLTDKSTHNQIPSAKAVFDAMQNGIEIPDLSNYATKEEVAEKADKTSLETQIGDIETALDNIITIQNELIGG